LTPLFLTAQHVGIGTNAPKARLHITDSAVLFSGAATAPPTATTIITPVQGAGTRQFWFPALGAFRTGFVNGAQWNHNNIGQLSFASGYNTIASGRVSTAMGFGTVASGDSATALGNGATASGNSSVAMGFLTAATANFSTATGIGSAATGYAATAMGYSTHAGGSFSTAMGSVSNASGTVSLATGERTFAKAYASVTIGTFNDSTDNPSAVAPATSDRIFQIGNGSGINNARSNALTVLRNGNTGIGTATPLARLHVTDSSVLFSAPGVDGSNALPPVSGEGRRMMWYPPRAAFRTGYVAGANWDKDSIGSFSFAAGYNTKAKGTYGVAIGFLTSATGNFSTAMGAATIASGEAATTMGDLTVASGQGAIAMGRQTTASGQFSTSMGSATTASGPFSTAMGYETTAKAFASSSIGIRNDDTDNPDPNNPNSLDRIFQIGNGASFTYTRSNVLTILRNGNTGIGTVTPLARLHVTDSSVLFSAPGVAGSNALPPVSGEGRRMMWYPPRAAFRTGYVEGTNWDKDNIGIFSFAAGYNPKASGRASAAFGEFSTASGQVSTAMGEFTTASDFASTAIGYQTNASGIVSTAMGYQTTASGAYATSMGGGTVATGNNALSMGSYSTASGEASASLGVLTFAKAYAAFTTGSYNDNTDNPGPTTPASSDRIFQIGNGTANNDRSNAITVLRNGNTGIGITDPAYRLDVGGRLRIRSAAGGFTAGLWLNNDANNASPSFIGMKQDDQVGFYGQNATSGGWRFYVNTNDGNAWLQGSLQQNSDMRLKKNIQPLNNALSKISQLNGYTYNWKDNSNTDEQIGLLAQEIQKTYPQLVKESDNGTLSVNYSGMIPVLLQAIKELKKENEEQQKQIDALKNKQ
ncbi:MAG: tail fiber domain-containing protein, partial [Dinghuibacter sp.]|nr:tail fiber domain-containing protein [Dinghuibacter sp.]